MADPRFFTNRGPFTVAEIAAATGVALRDVASENQRLTDVAPLDRAGANDLSFFDNTKYLEQFKSSKAGACFVRAKYAGQAPTGMVALVTADPYRAYALAAQQFYADEPAAPGIHPAAHVHPDAVIAPTAVIAAGAAIGARAQIGEYASIGANSVIAEGVVIGAHTRIGALSTISHSRIGSRVIIHRGVHIGQDGFGFAMGRDGHVKVPQLGCVVIGDDVEIGSGTTIDRGAGPDTVIGAGTKIDNLVQIGHNVTLGKGVVMVAQSGVSGSTRIGDGVVIGGQVGIVGHLTIGAGARIAGKSGVARDIPPGQSYGGLPAVPVLDWHRQTVAISRLVQPKRGQDE